MGVIKIIFIYVLAVAIAELLMTLLDILYMCITKEYYVEVNDLTVFNGTIAGFFLAYWIAQWLL